MQPQKEMPHSTLAGQHVGHLTTCVDEELLPPDIEPVNLHESIQQVDAYLRELVETGAYPSTAARMILQGELGAGLTFEDLVNIGERHWDVLKEQQSNVRSQTRGSQEEPLKVVSAHSLVSTTPPPRKFIIDNFISEDIAGIVAAPGGLSKSFFLLSMGVHLATGRSFLVIGFTSRAVCLFALPKMMLVKSIDVSTQSRSLLRMATNLLRALISSG